MNNNPVSAEQAPERRVKTGKNGFTRSAVAWENSPLLLKMTHQKDLHQALGSLAPETLERMIYLVGSARGGTSMSLHLIGGHPRVLGLPGPSHFINQVWRYRKVVHERLLKVIFNANGMLPVDDLLREQEAPRGDAARQLYSSAFASLDFRSLMDLFPLFSALDPARETTPDSYVAWMDKGNDANGIDELAANYPQAKFLFIVRDPRSAIATLTRVRAKQAAATDSQDPSRALQEAIYWRNLTQRSLRFAQANPGRSLIYAYERLVTDPAGVLGKIFEFLDLPALDETEMISLVEGIGFGSVWGGTGTGMSTAPILRWRDHLSADVVDLISEVCGPTARKLGYNMPRPGRRRGLTGKVLVVNGTKARAQVTVKFAYLAMWERRLRPPKAEPDGPHLLWSPDRQQAIEAGQQVQEAA